MTEEDFLEAFSHHPKIGDLESLREKYSPSARFSAREQSTDYREAGRDDEQDNDPSSAAG